VVLDSIQGIVVAIAPADLGIHATIHFLDERRVQGTGLFQRCDRGFIGNALGERHNSGGSRDHLGGVIPGQVTTKACKGRIADELDVQSRVCGAKLGQYVFVH